MSTENKKMTDLKSLLAERRAKAMGKPLDYFDDQALLAYVDLLEKVIERMEIKTKDASDHCLCHRNIKGFDYSEEHPNLGKPAIGARWLTPRDIIKDLQSEVRRMLTEEIK